MDQKLTEARREYLRKWRRENPDKVKANTERFWKRKAEAAEAAKALAAAEGTPAENPA